MKIKWSIGLIGCIVAGVLNVLVSTLYGVSYFIDGYHLLDLSFFVLCAVAAVWCFVNIGFCVFKGRDVVDYLRNR